ncbi:MAG TPA: HEAT repeat domain-containing protein [Gemmataceae bacterium]|nr:HEAT repeat domain-containing protein [Gemmataceae bacterium]
MRRLVFLLLTAGLATPTVRAEPTLRQLLKDPVPGVRLRAALTLAEAHDAEAIPVLIDLLAELPAPQRQRVEEFLTKLAGEWTPLVRFQGEDEIARKIRRDTWAAWWRNVDGASLLAAIRARTLTALDREKIGGLIGKLTGDFTAREIAVKELLALGRRSLPQLREAARDKNPDLARRAKELIEDIEQEPRNRLPVAVVRLLGVRKPAGAVAALLAYLPLIEGETRSDEVRKSLAVLALRDDKPDADLVRALDDAQPSQRAMAAEALIQGGGEQGRFPVRKLLKDAVPKVRMRVALAFALAREREGVTVLIDLLADLPVEQVGQVEDALYQLAGDSAPEVSVGVEPAERKKCRDAWAAWWKLNAGRVDLTRLTRHAWLGYTVLCDMGGGRVFEIDRDGKERWSIDNLRGPVDAVVLPGKRVLIAEYQSRRVTERDLTGKILWSKQVANPIGVQRLRNGNTFIATRSAVMEVDRSGKEVYTITNLSTISAAYRSRRGPIVCLTQPNQCIQVDTAGKQLKNFTCTHGNNAYGGLDVLPNGRILATLQDIGKVVEYDTDGKVVLELQVPGAMTATGLPNGHILVASQNTQRAFELDRTGKTVWEYKGAGPISRARRR